MKRSRATIYGTGKSQFARAQISILLGRPIPCRRALYLVGIQAGSTFFIMAWKYTITQPKASKLLMACSSGSHNSVGTASA